MLDIVIQQNVRLPEVIVSDILDSDHLPVIFHILDYVRVGHLSVPIEKFTDWERFRGIGFELISPRIKINSGDEDGKAAREFSASIALVYRLATSKITLTDLNNDLPGLDSLLKRNGGLENGDKKPGIQHVKRQ
jgi:hypothetical protein